MRALVRLVSSVFYLGYSPVAPGTMGSLGGVAVFYMMARLSWQWYGLVLGCLIIVAVWTAGKAEKIFQERDSRKIVIDELVGLLVATFALPFTWALVGVGFVLFRMLDIVKPFPARRLETLKGGAGVVADDIVVGIYTNLTLRIWMALQQR